jgi:hypothetical protein
MARSASIAASMRITAQLERLDPEPALGKEHPRLIEVVPPPLDLSWVEVGRDRDSAARVRLGGRDNHDQGLIAGKCGGAR